MSEFSEEQFIRLVQQAEQDANSNIKRYKLRLALFALLGYAVIFTVLTLLVLLVGGTAGLALISSSFALLLIKKKLILVVLFAIWTFLRALWVKFDAPSGFALTRKQYPALFAELDDLTNELNSLKIHQVFLDDQLNAAVVQHPRFGILGGQKNTLILGLQLLQALSPAEMRSVLAHEIGHLSGNHSRFSGWIYRIRLTWQRIMHAFEDSNSFGAKLMKRFFDWYAPKFSAYSFALARNNEFEADQIAAKLTTANTAAQALVTVHARAPHIEKDFWSALFDQADETAQPPSSPYQSLDRFLKTSPLSHQELHARIEREMAVETHYADTHPSLKDRVEAMSAETLVPEVLEKNAAEVWLGDSYQEVLKQFDSRWHENIKENWQARHAYVKKAKSALQEFETADIDSLTDQQLWDFANWSAEFKGEQNSLPLYRAYQERHSDSIGAAYYVGKILAAQKDPEALQHLKLAFDNPNTLEDAARWGYQLLKEKGDDINAQRWWDEALVANEIHESARQERANVTADDDFERPNMSYNQLQSLKTQLSEMKKVGAVWLAQKVLKNESAYPVYVIAFRPNGFYLDLDSVISKVAEDLDVNADIFVVSIWGDTKAIGREVKSFGVKIL